MNNYARNMMRDRLSRRLYGRRDGRRYDIRTYENNDERSDMARDRARSMRDRTYDRRDMGYNPTMDETYDMAYQDGYVDGMNEGFHNQVTPYGSRGMTVSDGKRGVKGTGRYGIGGSMYYGRDRANDMYDGANENSLSEEDMKEWKKSLKNADGTMGEHFDMNEIQMAMQSLGIQPKEYSMADLCMTANMLYSDYCDTLKNIIPKEKEAKYYTKLAENFLDDKDSSVKGSEKLAIYYDCIVSE